MVVLAESSPRRKSELKASDIKTSETQGKDGGESDNAVRRRRYTRTPLAGPLILTAEHVAILRFLAECRFLSLPQVASILGVVEKNARRRLRVLFDAGLVDVIPVSRVALAAVDAPNDTSLLFGSAPNIYSLTTGGHKAIVHEELARENVGRKSLSYGPKNGLFLAHELAVRDVRVWLEVLRRSAGLGAHISRWEVGKEAWINFGDPARNTTVRPDAWFAYELTGDARPLVLVGLAEIDRGTERGERHWWAKINGYQQLFDQQNALKAATGYIKARVLIFTPNIQRRDRLAETLIELVQQFNQPYELLTHFWLAEHSVLSGNDLTAPVWRRPGVSALLPLVSPKVLSSARSQS